MLAQQLVKLLRLPDVQHTARDRRVVHTQHGVNVLHTLGSDVRELLDLGCRVLDLLVGERKLELLDTALDSVPAGETMSDGDVSGQAKVLGPQDLIGAGVVEDGLGVNTGLVRKRAISARNTRLSDQAAYLP